MTPFKIWGYVSTISPHPPEVKTHGVSTKAPGSPTSSMALSLMEEFVKVSPFKDGGTLFDEIGSKVCLMESYPMKMFKSIMSYQLSNTGIYH